MRLVINKGIHAILTVLDMCTIACQGLLTVKTVAKHLLCFTGKPAHISGKSPRSNGTKEMKEGKSIFFVFLLLPEN